MYWQYWMSVFFLVLDCRSPLTVDALAVLFHRLPHCICTLDLNHRSRLGNIWNERESKWANRVRSTCHSRVDWFQTDVATLLIVRLLCFEHFLKSGNRPLFEELGPIKR